MEEILFLIGLKEIAFLQKFIELFDNKIIVYLWWHQIWSILYLIQTSKLEINFNNKKLVNLKKNNIKKYKEKIKIIKVNTDQNE